MTTSGVATFSVTMNELIYSSFQLAEIISSTDILDAADYVLAKSTLNMMIKAWQSRGYGLWLNQLVTLPLAANKQSYLLGPTGDHCSADMGETAIATAAALGASSIVVDSITGIASGQHVGIELDDGTIQWTTVNGAPSGVTVTLTNALTAAAAVDNVVFFYTNPIVRPLEILEARLRDASGGDTPLLVVGRQEYMDLPTKAATGKANQVVYDPQLGNGVLYVWTVGIDVSDRIIMTIKRPVYDFVSPNDTPDFPVEWYEALESGLAKRLAPKFRVTAQKKAELELLAKQCLDDADFYDREKTSVFFTAQMNPR
jgi:hypothetical protein